MILTLFSVTKVWPIKWPKFIWVGAWELWSTLTLTLYTVRKDQSGWCCVTLRDYVTWRRDDAAEAAYRLTRRCPRLRLRLLLPRGLYRCWSQRCGAGPRTGTGTWRHDEGRAATSTWTVPASWTRFHRWGETCARPWWRSVPSEGWASGGGKPPHPRGVKVKVHKGQGHPGLYRGATI